MALGDLIDCQGRLAYREDAMQVVRFFAQVEWEVFRVCDLSPGGIPA